jgi:hypothetical protein
VFTTDEDRPAREQKAEQGGHDRNGQPHVGGVVPAVSSNVLLAAFAVLELRGVSEESINPMLVPRWSLPKSRLDTSSSDDQDTRGTAQCDGVHPRPQSAADCRRPA